jgi:hypothetical protein
LRDERKREKKRTEKEGYANIWEKREGSHSKKKGIEEIAAADCAMTVNLEIAFLKDKIFVVMMAFDLRFI